MRGQLADVGAAGALPDGLVERGLSRSDGPALGQLMATAYRDTVDDQGEDDAWHAAEAERALQGDFGSVVWEASLVVVEANRLAGACIVTDLGPLLLVAFALVVPDWQNRGVGGTLMAHSAQALLAAGRREWTLAVTHGNPARRLYERLGFVRDESLRTTPPAHRLLDARERQDASMTDDAWSALADQFVDEEYASVKGQVRNYVLHQQLTDHLAEPPGSVLDVGGGAGHQSFPLARAGYEVTLLDPSPAMLSKAEHRLASEPSEVRDRVRLLQARGEDAVEATGGQRFTAVLCHGVLMYLERPEPLITSLCRCVAAGGVVSVMALNAKTLAIRPALERRWLDALEAFDAGGERGVLGVDTRADTVEELSALLRAGQVEPVTWYGVWLFTDWLDLPTANPSEARAVAAVELQASRRDPYRQLSRVFHLVGRRRADARTPEPVNRSPNTE